jgi:hypothetical protein
MGFPFPIASQLLKGAKWLEATHVDRGAPPPTPAGSLPRTESHDESQPRTESHDESATGQSESHKSDVQLVAGGRSDLEQGQLPDSSIPDGRVGTPDAEESSSPRPYQLSPVY